MKTTLYVDGIANGFQVSPDDQRLRVDLSEDHDCPKCEDPLKVAEGDTIESETRTTLVQPAVCCSCGERIGRIESTSNASPVIGAAVELEDIPY